MVTVTKNDYACTNSNKVDKRNARPSEIELLKLRWWTSESLDLPVCSFVEAAIQYLKGRCQYLRYRLPTLEPRWTILMVVLRSFH